MSTISIAAVSIAIVMAIVSIATVSIAIIVPTMSISTVAMAITIAMTGDSHFLLVATLVAIVITAGKMNIKFGK
jgi:hypothetical protein